MRSKFLFPLCAFLLLHALLVPQVGNATLCSDTFAPKHDKYPNFHELNQYEVEEIDFRITDIWRNSAVIVVAPHAGLIEPTTGEIAIAVARSDFNLYLFEGIKTKNNFDLHITSDSFDEPRALKAVSSSELALSIHGYKNNNVETILVGGRNKEAATLIAKALQNSGFVAKYPNAIFKGKSPQNIVNRAHKYGVQLEIPIKLRNRLRSDPTLLASFAQSVRNGLAQAFIILR